MENYQLYSTNILLGGQMKWDIILESQKGNLYISDFNMRPIHPTIPYNNEYKETLLNYKHSENLIKYYKQYSDYFFNIIYEPEYIHDWPISKEINNINPYIMGCNRMQYYELYEKQFEFFCPVWIEKLDKIENLSFNFILKDIKGKRIANKSLNFNKSTINFHNKFINYFDEYIDSLNIHDGNDNLLNIDFNNNATLSGVELTTGKLYTCDISNIINNLTYRERPLMESDNFIISNYKNNKIIASQLFNFNFCFNIEDIIPQHLLNKMMVQNITIDIDVYINNKKLSKKDFYTNYEYIPKKNINNTFINKQDINEEKILNVLSYLKDNEYISLINKNKFYPNIIHWSLQGNNDYIFNVYNGYSSYYKDGDKYIYNESYYMDTPNMEANTYSKIYNNTNWVNTYIIEDDNDVYDVFIKLLNDSINISKKYASYFQKGKNWISNILYDIKDDINIYIMNILVNDSGPDWESIMGKCTKIDDNLYIKMIDDKYLYIISNDENKLIFNNIKKILNNNNADELVPLKTIIDSYIEPKYITFNKSLNFSYVNGPDIKCKEIEYYKNNNLQTNVIRYDGKIKPTFIDSGNFVYTKEVYDENTKYKYDKYMHTGYNPLYKSIDYYAIKDEPLVYTKDNNDNIYEFKWYESNKILILKKSIESEYIYKSDKINKLDEVIKSFIKEYYNINNEGKIEYIYNLYNDEIYALNIEDKDKNKYHIKLTLK